MCCFGAFFFHMDLFGSVRLGRGGSLAPRERSDRQALCFQSSSKARERSDRQPFLYIKKLGHGGRVVFSVGVPYIGVSHPILSEKFFFKPYQICYIGDMDDREDRDDKLLDGFGDIDREGFLFDVARYAEGVPLSLGVGAGSIEEMERDYPGGGGVDGDMCGGSFGGDLPSICGDVSGALGAKRVSEEVKREYEDIEPEIWRDLELMWVSEQTYSVLQMRLFLENMYGVRGMGKKNALRIPGFECIRYHFLRNKERLFRERRDFVKGLDEVYPDRRGFMPDTPISRRHQRLLMGVGILAEAHLNRCLAGEEKFGVMTLRHMAKNLEILGRVERDMVFGGENVLDKVREKRGGDVERRKRVEGRKEEIRHQVGMGVVGEVGNADGGGSDSSVFQEGDWVGEEYMGLLDRTRQIVGAAKEARDCGQKQEAERE